MFSNANAKPFNRAAIMADAWLTYRWRGGRQPFTECLRKAWGREKAHRALLAMSPTAPAPASRRLYSRESGRRAANFAA